jgi:outer membrane immunogenic protein
MKLLMAAAIGVAVAASAQAGMAADLQVETPVVSSASNWDGTYVGAFVGYGKGMAYQPDDESDFLPDFELPLEGATLGATAGADFLVSGRVIAGMVGDLAWSRLHGGQEFYSDVDINWTASLRGKLGYDAGAFLPYLTGGLAAAVINVNNNTFDVSNIHFGWTAGLGTEIAISDALSLDLLYRYSDYGQVAYDDDIHFSATAHTLSVGLNWRF